jgi:peptidyl-prolyl cis-trans isomerase D
MPIMTRMRDSMPMILFGLLIAFLITIVFDWGMGYFGLRGSDRAELLGKVNGKKISYQEFSGLVKNFSDAQKSQGGQEPDEAQLRQIRDQAWQTLVTQRLVEDEIKRVGISVTDQELVDWVRGDNPPEDLKRNFIDSTGQFRKDLYDEFLNNPGQFFRESQSDPDYGSRWLAQYEKSLRQRRVQEKLQSLVVSTVRVTEGELRQRFAEQNQKYDALYASFDAGTLVQDKDVQVTDADIKAYYEESLEQYKVEASRKLKYVLFPEKPSASDSAGRWKDMEDAVAKARGGQDFLQVVYTYSEKPDSGAFFRHGELSTQLENAVFSAKVGELVGPVLDVDGLHLMKVLGQRTSDKEFVHASHILLTFGADQDSNSVKSLAQTVVKSAREGKDFAELARQYSKDPGSAQQGGDLGWFPRGRMVPAFDAAAFRAKAGEIVGPVRSQFGYHIIKVQAKDTRELKLANVLMKITPSSQTKNDLLDRARDFTYVAKSSEFTKEAQAIGYDAKETQILDKSGVIPGVGINEAVSRWSFNNKVGSVSEPFEIANGYAVFEITEAKNAGVKPLDEVKESLKPQVLRKKKIERTRQIAADMRAKLAPNDSLTKLAQIAPSVKVQETGPFTLVGAIPGIGRDPNFMGAASALQAGEISPPFQGLRGSYVIQLLSRSTFDSAAFASQREGLLSRLLQEKRGRFLSEWLAKLKENADIEDNRDLFRF